MRSAVMLLASILALPVGSALSLDPVVPTCSEFLVGDIVDITTTLPVGRNPSTGDVWLFIPVLPADLAGPPVTDAFQQRPDSGAEAWPASEPGGLAPDLGLDGLGLDRVAPARSDAGGPVEVQDLLPEAPASASRAASPTEFWGLMSIVCGTVDDVLRCLDDPALAQADLATDVLCSIVAQVQAIAACLAEDSGHLTECSEGFGSSQVSV
ncbi:MAG: hypothetical protein ACYC2H_08405 [Thermoplasmatota archaeon]